MVREVRRDERNRILPGSGPLNPTGKNQWTYRRDFEMALSDLLKAKFRLKQEVVEPGETEGKHCLVCGLLECDAYAGAGIYAHRICVGQLDGLTRGQVIALVTVQRAMMGDEKILPEVLARLWPKITSVEVPQLEALDAPALRALLAPRAGEGNGSRDPAGNGADRDHGPGV